MQERNTMETDGIGRVLVASILASCQPAAARLPERAVEPVNGVLAPASVAQHH